MYDKCYFCLDQLPKLKKESTASFFVNFGGAGVQKSQPTLLYTGTIAHVTQYSFIPIAPDTAWWELMQAPSYQALAPGCPGQSCSTRLQMHSSN